MRKHPTTHLSRNEEKLLRLFRGIQSKHERDAIMVLLASIALGRLGKAADKHTTRGLMRGL
jgi:hypothetical protein